MAEHERAPRAVCFPDALCSPWRAKGPGCLIAKKEQEELRRRDSLQRGQEYTIARRDAAGTVWAEKARCEKMMGEVNVWESIFVSKTRRR